MKQEKLVNIEGLSTGTGVPVRTLRTWLQQKMLPHYRLGHRTILFDEQQVRSALAKNFFKRPATERRR
jgi:excisionase family DNA binding protein